MREGSQSERAEVFPGVTHHGNPIFELLDQFQVAFGILFVLHILCLFARGFGERADQLLDLADREAFLDAPFQHAQLLVGGRPGDGFGVSHRDQPLLEGELHLVGEFQQAQVVRHRRTLLAHLLRQGVLREVALVDQALHAQRDFDGVEVLSLDVLHEGHGVQVLVVHLADIGREGLQVGPLRGPPAAFAADDDVFASVALFHRHGLDDAQLADRVGQFVQSLLVELRARLRGVGYDVGDFDFCHLTHRFELGIHGIAAENGVESAS